MKIKIKKNKIEISSRIRMIGLMVLVLGMSYMVVLEYSNWRFLVHEDIASPKQISQGLLPQFSPKKEIMANNALRSEIRKKEKDELVGKYSLNQFVIKKNIEKLVGSRPIRTMVSEIATRDLQTASYLVAIAKHESNLGKFSPKKDGRDCYNYWGYRGTYNKTKSGYSCFDSPAQAVSVVGNRIQGMTRLENRNTPEEMLVWKCGKSCANHDPMDVERWKNNVDWYFKKINLISLNKEIVEKGNLL
jgi:hypothetical protein